jgi:hypothetical protein
LSDIPTLCHFNNKEAKALVAYGVPNAFGSKTSECLRAGMQEARMSEDAFSRLFGLKYVNNMG